MRPRPTPPPGSSVSLRRYVTDDAAFVAELSKRAFGEYGGQPARYTLGAIEQDGTQAWLAIERGVPVGMVVVEVSGRRAAVLAVAVSERARGCGIGGVLMEQAEHQTRAQGARVLSLCTADCNLAALDLFLRRGFRIVRRRPRYYIRRQDACELEKVLAAPTEG